MGGAKPLLLTSEVEEIDAVGKAWPLLLTLQVEKSIAEIEAGLITVTYSIGP